MISEITIERDRTGLITAPASLYNPSPDVRDRISQLLLDFRIGRQIQQKPYREFNDISLFERMSLDQRSFNTFRPPKSNDPDDSWRSNAVRPIVRNRVISVAAHVTGAVIHPQVFAQNNDDNQDKDAEVVMRDLMEWAGDQANYPKTFIYAVISALVNPGMILHTEYAEHYRTIKELNETGEGWKEKKILDELMSGFQDTVVPMDELLIGDIYEHSIQKQPFLFWRRVIDYQTAKAKYGDNQLFNDYVRPGLYILYDTPTNTFYEQYDRTLQLRLVEEIIYYNRSADLELVIINGVLITDPNRPNPRKDKMYPFVKSGYELIDEGRFFYHTSLVRKMSADEDVINTLYRMVIDGSFLQLMPPAAIYGNEEVTSSVFTPGTVTIFKEPNTKLEKFDVGHDINAGRAALEKVESSLSESSNDPLQSGLFHGPRQTAYMMAALEQNAKIMLGLFTNMIGFMVRDFGFLRMGDILQHLTVAEVDQITDKVRSKSFLLSNKHVNGKKKTRKIIFANKMKKNMTSQDHLNESFNVLQEQGGSNSDLEIYKVNPELFSSLKYRLYVRPDIATPMNDAMKKQINLEEYDRAVQNPLADQEMVFKKLLLGSYETTKDNVDEFVKKTPPMPQSSPGTLAQMGSPSGIPTNQPMNAPQNPFLAKLVGANNMNRAPLQVMGK